MGLGCLLTFLLLAPAVAATDPGSQIERAVQQEKADLESRTVGLLRVRGGQPLRLSGGFGWMRSKQPVGWDCRTVCDHHGPLIQLEPGLSGVQLAAGWGHLIGETRRGTTFLKAVYFGYGARAVVMRSYGDSPLDPERQTLVGAEGDFTIASVNFSLGVLHRVSPGGSEDRWVLGWGLGWGF